MSQRFESESSPPIRTRQGRGGVLRTLPDGHRYCAHEIGKLRVVQAGYRMAEFFNGQ